jgi:curli production assembly/transport component CsgF
MLNRRMPRRLALGSCCVGAALAAMFVAAPAGAQDLVHRFITPSFGGNPFYSDHLLSIANIHRPAAPEEETEDPPSNEQLIAQQIRARFLSQLSGDIIDRIQDAEVGDSGNFEFGDQRISFTRTTAGTRITFLNQSTGETQELFLPAQDQSASLLSTAATKNLASPSAEQVLSVTGSGAGLSSGNITAGLLDPGSLEIPLRGQ